MNGKSAELEDQSGVLATKPVPEYDNFLRLHEASDIFLPRGLPSGDQ